MILVMQRLHTSMRRLPLILGGIEDPLGSLRGAVGLSHGLYDLGSLTAEMFGKGHATYPSTD